MRRKSLIVIFLSSIMVMFANLNCSGSASFNGISSQSSNSTGGLPTGNASISLAWDANTESDLAGYRIYYGVSANQLVAHIDVGLTTAPASPAAIVSSLVKANTYFFAVKAYNSSGLESTFSNMVSATAK